MCTAAGWTAGDRQRFENGLNEANTEPLADFDSAFDTQLGFAVRAHCAPLLGLPKHAEPQEYWQRRSQLAETELARLFLRAAGVSDWLVDTGYAEGVADVGAGGRGVRGSRPRGRPPRAGGRTGRGSSR